MFALLKLATIGQDEEDAILLEECLHLATSTFAEASSGGDPMATFLIARLMLANGYFDDGCSQLEVAAF